jgi:hypothetical protein
MRTIVFNQNNLVQNGNNNTLVYKFPNSVTFSNSEVAISQITMYYSWFNITSALSNNTFTFNWITSNNDNIYQTYTITIPDGLYEIASLNAFLQFVFINAGSLPTSVISPATGNQAFYLVNSSGDNVYYAEFVVNPTAYAIQLNTYNVPTALPAGWTNPGLTILPDVAPAESFNPVITTPAAFNAIVGFATTFSSDQNQNNAGANPGTATAYKIGSTYSYLSTITPQVQPNPNLLVAISGIDNVYASPSSIIYSLAPSVAIGQLIVEKPPEFNFNKLMRGTYNELRLQFLGTNLQPVVIKDPNMTILLVIKESNEQR